LPIELFEDWDPESLIENLQSVITCRLEATNPRSAQADFSHIFQDYS